MESDDGMFIDMNYKYDGDEALKCKDADGNNSDLVTENLVRKDKAADEIGNFYNRFRPHHGVAFVAMAKMVRDRHPDVKLGEAADEALEVFDRLHKEIKDLEEYK